MVDKKYRLYVKINVYITNFRFVTRLWPAFHHLQYGKAVEPENKLG